MQIQKITVQKIKTHRPYLFVEEYIKGVVIEENSPETIHFLSQLMSSFFIARGEKQRI